MQATQVLIAAIVSRREDADAKALFTDYAAARIPTFKHSIVLETIANRRSTPHPTLSSTPEERLYTLAGLERPKSGTVE